VKGARREIGSIEEKNGGARRMSLRHKLRIACSILLVFLLILSNTSFIPSVRATPSGLNFSLAVFEDTGTAGDRSDDTKRSFSGLYSATYSYDLQSGRTRLATRFTKVGEINKVRVCWKQGTSVSGTAYIRIETDNVVGPKPSGTLADADAEISVAASFVPTSLEWCEYTFPGPVTLSESNWYWIVLKYEPTGSEAITVRGSYSISYGLPPNINFGAVYTTDWSQSTDWGYVAFVIPETTHSLPLYRRTTLGTELPMEAGLNQIADLPNDVNRVYRIVMQIQPKIDQWKWAPDDAAATDYYIRDAGSTSAADMDTSDSAARPQFIVQQAWVTVNSYPDIFVSGNQASEWNGKSSITLTERGAVDANAEGDGTGKGINCYDGSLSWDDVNDIIALDNWQVIEFWFKLDDDWADNDVAELRYVQAAEGGHDPLSGFVYRVKVGMPGVDTYASDYATPKDPYNLGDVVYAKATGFPSEANWLSGWDKRLRMTLDRSDVTSDLTNFPVMICLSTSSGRQDDDVSFVFDELQSDANRKKIAVTKSDGTTECYVEIERWDDASEQAWLWVKVPNVNGTGKSENTALYLYYDKDHADNTAYVGDSDSSPAENVWDTNHKGVWHLGQETNGSWVMKDSTLYNNDGTPRYGAVLGAAGQAGKAVDLDGNNDHVYCPDSASLDISGTGLTMSVWIAPDFDQTRSANAITVDKRGGGNNAAYRLFWRGSTEFDWCLRITAGGTDSNLYSTDVTWTVDTWHYLVGTYDGTNMRIYWDGVQENFLSKTGSISTSDYNLGIAGYNESNIFDGTVDEVRISDTPRSAAWIRASYESERDHFVDFEAEQVRGCHFRYYKGAVLKWEHLNVNENASGGWRSQYQPAEPGADWVVKVYDAQTNGLRCSCTFGVTLAGPQKIEYQIDLLNHNVAQTLTYTSSSTYEDFTVQSHRQAVLIDLSQFVSPTCYFEAILCVQDVSFAAYAALFDQGTSDSTGSSATQVTGSEVTAQSTSYVRVRSGAITLTSGNRYRVKIHRSGSGSQYMWIRAARIIVVDDITYGWTTGEEQIEIGQCQNVNNNATHAKPLNPPVYYLYEAAKRDGTVTIYFEACFVTTSAGLTAYCYLWCKTDNTSVVTLQTTETWPPKRMRSASISLTDGKEYEVRTRAPTGASCTLSGARLIIQQSGTITKTQLIKECGSYESGSTVERNMHQTLYDASKITPTKTIYYETCLRSDLVAYTASSDLYNATGSAAVSGSQVDTSSTSTVLLRSGALILATGKEYDSRGWCTAGYQVSKARIIIDVAVAEVDTYASDYTALKDIYLIGETVYAKATGLSTQAGWLSGWDKRVKLTIDQNDVDSDLTDFPVLIYLSTSSGRGSDDVSFVFDELQSNDNRKKIAVTKSDGTTQCFVEIEKWDDASEKAWLWVKAPSVSGTVDTDLYLYYDKDHADNIVRVGDTDSTPAENVWDTNHKGVWHLDEATGGSGAMKDSTSNNNDGTDSGSPTLGTAGITGNAVDFDGTDDYLNHSDSSSLDVSGTGLTISAWVAPDFLPTTVNSPQIVNKMGTTINAYRLFFRYDVNDWRFTLGIASSTTDLDTQNINWAVDTWHQIVATYDGSNMRIYWDGLQNNSKSQTGTITTNNMPLIIGYGKGGAASNYFDGTIDEVRISDYPRGAAWIKAGYESGRDHLIDFGGEQTGPRYDFKYYSDWTGTPDEEGFQLNVGESPSGEWRSLYTLLGDDPAGTWGVKVFDTGTSTERCSCSFTVQSAVPEFPHGAIAAVVTCFAIYLAKRKRLEINRLRVKQRVG